MAIMTEPAQKDALSQSDEFKQAARDLECDPDEKAWDERLRKVAGQKPAGRPDAD